MIPSISGILKTYCTTSKTISNSTQRSSAILYLYLAKSVPVSVGSILAVKLSVQRISIAGLGLGLGSSVQGLGFSVWSPSGPLAAVSLYKLVSGLGFWGKWHIGGRPLRGAATLDSRRRRRVGRGLCCHSQLHHLSGHPVALFPDGPGGVQRLERQKHTLGLRSASRLLLTRQFGKPLDRMWQRATLPGPGGKVLHCDGCSIIGHASSDLWDHLVTIQLFF
jgi:hypothetical protein